MSKIIYRHATVDDLPKLRHLWADLYSTEVAGGLAYALRSDAADIWERETAQRLNSPNYYFLIAVEDGGGEIVGFHCGQIRRRPSIYEDTWIGSVIEIYVSPAWRKQKIARYLLEMALEIMATRGIKKVEVQTVPGNTASQAFWTSMGWVEDLMQYRKDLR